MPGTGFLGKIELKKFTLQIVFMEYSVRPSRQELEKVKSKIDDCVNRYNYALEIDDVEFFLSWQRHEGSLSVLDASDKEVMIAVNPGKDEYSTEGVLRALLELEFIEKTSYSKISFKWQEVAKFAYTALRMKDINSSEIKRSEDIVARWPAVQEQLGDKVNEYEEFFYMNTGLIGETLASKIVENHSAEEITEMKMSDIKSVGEQFF